MTIQDKLKLELNRSDPKNGWKLHYKPIADEGGEVTLEINGSTNRIGNILIGQKNVLYHKHENESNIFQATKAWSINDVIARSANLIVYETPEYDYMITQERAKEFGKNLHFPNTELKLYVPLIYWEKRKKSIKESNPVEFRWRNRVGDSWYEVLKETLHSDMMSVLATKINALRKANKIIYPEPEKIFRAFRLCTFEHTKVILVGMSPYHDGSADGLAFSYLHGSKKPIQKSLEIIYHEVERDCYKGLHLDHDYDLNGWAKQGVLLLNSVLTVEKGKPESHYNIGWERFVRITLYKLLCDPTPKVFVFWGNKAQEQMNAILQVWYKHNTNMPIHLILTAKHPAFDLRQESKSSNGFLVPDYPKTFSGCGHFSKANEFLKNHKRQIITW